MTADFSFNVLKTSRHHQGRIGILNTPHGAIRTPVFMPVGTLGTVKAVLPEMLIGCGTEIILANTYHLLLRPGTDVLRDAGGLHAFMNWHKPILTDSGGYQVYSLSKLVKLKEEGVEFRSHLNGEAFFLSPEDVVRIQQDIGADIIMPLDECLPQGVSRKKTMESLNLTTRWAKRSLSYLNTNPHRHRQILFGIIQGGMFPDCRKESARQLIDCNFFGYAIGGLSVGEEKPLLMDMLGVALGEIPDNKPRYLMGVGSPEDIDACMREGVDMFDCVLPTRLARHGAVFSSEGTYSIKKKQWEKDFGPMSEGCECYTCRNYTKAYLRHLWRNKEFISMSLLSIHNIQFLMDRVKMFRESIEKES